MTVPKYLFTDDASEALDELEADQAEYLEWLNLKFQKFGTEEYDEDGNKLTLSQRTALLEDRGIISPYQMWLSIKQKEEREEERKEAAFTPLGMPREIIVDGEVVNTYDFLVETMGFEPYTKGSVLNILTDIDDLKNLQQQLKDAGYLTAGTYNPGIVNTATTQAMERLLSDANNAKDPKKENGTII